GEWPDAAIPAPTGALSVEHEEAVEYLNRCPPQSFGAFTLSNILDGVSADYASRLEAAIARAAAPGAVVVLRSLGEPETAEEDTWASRDRALLWGAIRVERK